MNMERFEGLAQQHPLRILVAEDNPINQMVIFNTLESLGYSADLANNGREVLALVSKKVYDVIFMDILMPEMDGIWAAEKIRADWPADRQPRIIGLTAHALEEIRQQCLEAGMDEYFQKPLELEKLVAVLKQTKRLE